MGKVYRLHEGAEGTGWFTSKIFNDEELETILTDGKEVSNSIPSPFARIDLVNEAFRWVAQNNLEGNKAQHKLVSDALDIGQLIFYSDKFRNKIEIEDYSPKQRISENFGDVVRKHRELAKTFDDKMARQVNDDKWVRKHRELAKTFDVYWEQDAGVYNFNKTDSIHFVLYNKEIIGATSPKSLFFSAPFHLGLRDEITIQRATGKYFGEKAVPLNKREWDFVVYLYVLARQPQFADYFPDLYEYLDKVKAVMDSDQRRALNELTSDQINEYDKCHVTGQSTNYCKVIDYSLHTAKEKVHSIENESDFVIDSDYEVEGNKPLVLPNGTFSEEWIYTTKDVKWLPKEYNGKIPNKNDDLLTESKLPITGDKYPWLTVDNFLEDKIIKLPYEIDSSKFVTGKGKSGNQYLLPLTETFFKYFDTSSVAYMLSIEELGQGTVITKLDIKTKGGVVKFEKLYRNESKVSLLLYLSILPFIKINAKIPIKYNIGIIDGDVTNSQNNKFSSSCYYKGEFVELSEPVVRSPGLNREKSTYASTDKLFDTIRITFNNEVHGFVIPLMREYEPGFEKCSFAVDFGSTNTHIEYKIEDNIEKAFDNLSNNPIWASLIDKNSDTDRVHLVNEEIFENELFPKSIGADSSLAKFPLRTATAESDVDFNKAVEIFKHLNNYLLYEKRPLPDYYYKNTKLKWEDLDDPRNRIRLKAYLENLCWLIYYKVLTLNIDPAKVKVTWFYPISMGKFQRGLMESAWRENLKKIFGTEFKSENLNSIPESIGPYIYYYEVEGITGDSVSIDIGGGSTDISIFNQNQTKLISSIRFAGDVIFGDGYTKNPDKNGFVNLAKKQAYSYLKSNNINEGILDDILKKRKVSNDFSSYLFSLTETSKNSFNYTSIIKTDPNVKLVMLIFHAALAYYIGKLLHLENYKTPKQILFSGSASKTVSLLDSNSSLVSIAGLYLFIFNSVNNKNTGEDLKCELSKIPKEITCKGGLLNEKVKTDGYKQYFWLGGSDKWNMKVDLTKLSNIPKYADIDEQTKNNVSKSVQSFYDLLDSYVTKVDLESEFGISRNAYQKFKKTRAKELMDDLSRGIDQTMKEQHEGKDESIDQSLFFHPLIGELNRLAFDLSEISKK